MARRIEATPVLKGKDAAAFLAATKLTEPISAERRAWLDSLARASKAVENKKAESL